MASEDENEYDKNKSRFRNRHQYSRYKKYLSMMMLICIKQHLCKNRD